MGVNENKVGFFIALPCLVYSIACAVVGLFTKYVPRVYLTELAFLITFGGMLMFGPSEILNFPKDLALSTCGICIVAFSCALIFVPLLSEIVEAVLAKEGLQEATEELNDLAAGFFNTAYAIGCLIAPIIGGALNDAYNFRITCDVMAFSSGAYAVVFFFISIVPYLLT
jgi:MFS family permease